jgi:hypothetical protein
MICDRLQASKSASVHRQPQALLPVPGLLLSSGVSDRNCTKSKCGTTVVQLFAVGICWAGEALRVDICVDSR